MWFMKVFALMIFTWYTFLSQVRLPFLRTGPGADPGLLRRRQGAVLVDTPVGPAHGVSHATASAGSQAGQGGGGRGHGAGRGAGVRGG